LAKRGSFCIFMILNRDYARRRGKVPPVFNLAEKQGRVQRWPWTV